MPKSGFHKKVIFVLLVTSFAQALVTLVVSGLCFFFLGGGGRGEGQKIRGLHQKKW